MEVGMRERSEKLRETLRLWDAFIKDAPLAEQIHTQCRILINLWRSELESIDAVAKCRNNKAKLCERVKVVLDDLLAGLSVGDLVSPKTSAGLELSDVAVDGKYKQDIKVICVFKGVGVVKDIKNCIIDYNMWDRMSGKYEDECTTGKVNFTSYLIECEDGRGWAGMGAIIPARSSRIQSVDSTHRKES